MDQRPCLHRVSVVHDPYFGPRLMEGDFAHDALCIFIEYAGVDACLREQTTHQMRIGKRLRGIDFQHQSSVSMNFGRPFTRTASIPALPNRSTATRIEIFSSCFGRSSSRPVPSCTK